MKHIRETIQGIHEGLKQKAAAASRPDFDAAAELSAGWEQGLEEYYAACGEAFRAEVQRRCMEQMAAMEAAQTTKAA
jgi:hypothetical protein